MNNNTCFSYTFHLTKFKFSLQKRVVSSRQAMSFQKYLRSKGNVRGKEQGKKIHIQKVPKNLATLKFYGKDL